MGVGVTDLLGTFSPEFVAALEGLVDARVEAKLVERENENNTAAPSPYMTVIEAAEFLRSSRQRIHDLLSARRLQRYKDGARTLVRREEIERYVAGSGR
jgi:excisionase family DNA binding protein